jgi:hypothetical protein
MAEGGDDNERSGGRQGASRTGDGSGVGSRWVAADRKCPTAPERADPGNECLCATCSGVPCCDRSFPDPLSHPPVCTSAAAWLTAV